VTTSSSAYSRSSNVSTIRRPLGTNFARPSGHDSFANETLLKIVLLSLTGTAADIICCQILWFHSLASVDEAVKTIRGEAMGKASSGYKKSKSINPNQ
jgi:hypothetical protein